MRFKIRPCRQSFLYGYDSLTFISHRIIDIFIIKKFKPKINAKTYDSADALFSELDKKIEN